MKINKIITLANKEVRLRFLAMERSLRATGCKLPIWVIPYDDNLFELPKGSKWWAVPEIIKWLAKEKAYPTMRKYQCLTESNYQFVDSDVIFLRNPETVLNSLSGFVTSCCHWSNPEHTYTHESLRFLKLRGTIWQKYVFNSGQFACDRPIFSIKKLKETATRPDFVKTCIKIPFYDVEQPGVNLLVSESKVNITNLTLPPYNMESTWAGHYNGEYEHYWKDPKNKPYLIHWAGVPMYVPRQINEIFYRFLSPEEKLKWGNSVRGLKKQQERKQRGLRALARKIKHAYQAFTRL